MRSPWRIFLFTGFALCMFAANSLLCRMALGGGSIDAASYSTIRLISGALMLALIGLLRGAPGVGGDLNSSLMLFLYMVPFSFAYLGLSTGTGALILFGCVQVTMIMGGWQAGERPNRGQWAGVFIALAGLIYLVFPGLNAPALLPAGLMAVAGVAWGLYSLRGRRAGDPFVRTRGNFIRAVPMVLVVSAIAWPWHHIDPQGAVLAAVSGSVASGLGYAAWYAALKHLTAVRASVLQLLVPILAALSGVLVLAETLGVRLIISAVLVLGGVWITLRPVRR